MRCLRWRGMLGVLACVLVSLPALGSNADVNVITRIERVASGVEIEVKSSRPFPVRALGPELRVGTGGFLKSRSPEDGSLNALIFMLTAEEFAQTSMGDPVSVGYGQSMLPEDRWDFGPLDKSTLEGS